MLGTRAGRERVTCQLLLVAVLSVLGAALTTAVHLTPASAHEMLRTAGLPADAPAVVTTTDADVLTATWAVPPVVVTPAVAAPPPPPPPAPAPAAAPPAPVLGAPQPAPDPSCSGAGFEQRRGEAALASLRRPSDAVAFGVRFLPGRTDLLGLAHLHEQRVEIYVRSCAKQSAALLRHVLAHELGHLLDATRLTDTLRAQWMSARGIAAGTPWFGCDGCTDFATPAGDFAEVYAQWQTGAASNRSRMAPAPGPAEIEQLAQRFFG